MTCTCLPPNEDHPDIPAEYYRDVIVPYIRGRCPEHGLPEPYYHDRFWERVDKNGPVPEYAPDLGNCWLWTKSIKPDGYAQITVAGHRHYIHRFSFELNGGVIPTGFFLDHLCRVRHCVRPSHLELVTNQENTRRGKALITHCPQGHAYDQANTILYRGRRYCRQCMYRRAAEREIRTRRWEARNAKRKKARS